MIESFLFFSFFYDFGASGLYGIGSGASSFFRNQPLLFVPKEDKETEIREALLPQEEKNDRILCGTCLELMTKSRNKVERGGSWEHTFTNAYGYLFRVGCFSEAPGCIVAGEPTSDFTWFKGYNWQFSFCRYCTAHLGWYYSSGSDSFYGLILPNLVFE